MRDSVEPWAVRVSEPSPAESKKPIPLCPDRTHMVSVTATPLATSAEDVAFCAVCNAPNSWTSFLKIE